MRIWWDGEMIAEVMHLVSSGLTDAEVERTTGIPAQTVRNYRRGRIPRRAGPELTGIPTCSRCREIEHDWTTLNGVAYSYLLAVYLGDGCLSSGASPQLRVALDTAYPGIIQEVGDAVAVVRGRRPFVIPDRRGRAYVTLVANWKQWPCYFPQHGPGRKHHRKIELAAWQQSLVDQAPEAFLRGLIQTDGWRGLNKVRVKGKDYAYPRYQFSNRSDDIRRMFTDTCDVLDIRWRPWGRWHISVARKDAVARMDAFIGPKS